MTRRSKIILGAVVALPLLAIGAALAAVFVILPRMDLPTAVSALQRCRTELPMACSRAGLPAFTFSAGVADGPNSNATQQMRAADAALYRAKQTGRDRVLCASDLLADPASTQTASAI